MAPLATFTVPEGYQYVLVTIAAAYYLNFWQFYKVGFARRDAGIKYPQLYAEKAEVEASEKARRFNCIQRAHQNTLEQTPHILLGILFTGLKHPRLATGFGIIWLVGRVLYTIGYSTGDADGRNKMSVGIPYIPLFGLFISIGYTAFQILADGL